MAERKTANYKKWTMVDRVALSGLLKAGWSLKDVSKELAVCDYALRKELKYGMEQDDFSHRRYGSYDPLMAIRRRAYDAIGEDGLDALIEEESSVQKGRGKKE